MAFRWVLWVYTRGLHRCLLCVYMCYLLGFVCFFFFFTMRFCGLICFICVTLFVFQWTSFRFYGFYMRLGLF